MEHEDAETERGKPGPKPDTLKIEGMDWEEAMRRALQVKRPEGGWPDSVKKTRQPKKPR